MKNKKNNKSAEEKEITLCSFAKNATETVQCNKFNYKGTECIALAVYETFPNGQVSEYFTHSVCMSTETWKKNIEKIAEAIRKA